MDFLIVEVAGFSEVWWFFEDWQDHIEQEHHFRSEKEARIYFGRLKKTYQRKFSKQKIELSRATGFELAFYDEDDFRYCQECGDEMQWYTGIALLTPETQVKHHYNKGANA